MERYTTPDEYGYLNALARQLPKLCKQIDGAQNGDDSARIDAAQICRGLAGYVGGLAQLCAMLAERLDPTTPDNLRARMAERAGVDPDSAAPEMPTAGKPMPSYADRMQKRHEIPTRDTWDLRPYTLQQAQYIPGYGDAAKRDAGKR